MAHHKPYQCEWCSLQKFYFLYHHNNNNNKQQQEEKNNKNRAAPFTTLLQIYQYTQNVLFIDHSSRQLFEHAQEAHIPQSGNYWRDVTQATLGSDGNFFKIPHKSAEVSLALCNNCIPTVNIQLKFELFTLLVLLSLILP
jgi:hypothetical protein